MKPELIELIEDEHETIDACLDRIASRRPELDEEALTRLERHLTRNLTRLYRTLHGATHGVDTWYRTLLVQRPREWLGLLRVLRRQPTGTDRWWTRMRDLEDRIRGHFNEVETQVLDLLDSDEGQAHGAEVGSTSRDRTC